MRKKDRDDHYPELDLHGRRVDEVPDLVDRFIRNCQSRGKARARIITGRGTGAVERATLEWLKRGGYPAKRENPGSWIVFVDD